MAENAEVRVIASVSAIMSFILILTINLCSGQKRTHLFLHVLTFPDGFLARNNRIKAGYQCEKEMDSHTAILRELVTQDDHTDLTTYRMFENKLTALQRSFLSGFQQPEERVLFVRGSEKHYD